MATNQVLNVVDEVIDGTPKYTITDNDDGTKGISLANSVTTQGTSINKALFNKVDNIMSYLTPSVTQTPLQIVISGTTNPLPTSWTETGSNYNTCYGTSTISHFGTIHIVSTVPYGSGYRASYAVDGSTSNSYVSSSVQEQWYRLQFDIPILIKSMQIVIGSYGTVDLTCEIQGSNDGTNYDTLWTGTFSNNNTLNITLNNSNEYTYYRIYRNETSTSDYYRLGIAKISITSWQYTETQYKNQFLLDNNTSFVNKQRVLIETPKVNGFNINYNSSKNFTTSAWISTKDFIKLNNDNIMLLYSDASDNKGYFEIYDNDLNAVVSKTNFESNSTSGIYAAVLNNTNVFVKYIANSVSNYCIISQSGTIISSGSFAFKSNYDGLCTLSNGNIIFAYNNMTDSQGYYTILDSSGNIVYNSTLFNSSYTYGIKTIQANNKIFIIYGTSDYLIKCTILDSDYSILNTITLTSDFSSYTATLGKNDSIVIDDDVFVAVSTGETSNNYYQFIKIDSTDYTITKSTITTGLNNARIVNYNNNIICYGINSSKYIVFKKISTDFNELYTNTSTTYTADTYGKILINDSNVFIVAFDSSSPYTSNILKYIIYDITDGMTLDDVTSNTINNITCDTLLQPSTKYELIYNSTSSKFELGGTKTLFDITLTEAVNQVNLTGITNMLQEDRIYSLSIIGGVSTASNICFGNTSMIYCNLQYVYTPFFFEFKHITDVDYIIGLKNLLSGSNTGFDVSQINGYEYIKVATTSYTFNAGTRIIIKEVA